MPELEFASSEIEVSGIDSEGSEALQIPVLRREQWNLARRADELIRRRALVPSNNGRFSSRTGQGLENILLEQYRRSPSLLQRAAQSNLAIINHL